MGTRFPRKTRTGEAIGSVSVSGDDERCRKAAIVYKKKTELSRVFHS